MTFDKIMGVARPLPEGTDLDSLIREASNDGIDRRYLRWRIQCWQESQEAAGLDPSVGDPDDPNLVLEDSNLAGLCAILRQWYTDDELRRLLPDMLALFIEE